MKSMPTLAATRVVNNCSIWRNADDSQNLVSISAKAIIEPSAPPPLLELREKPMASWNAMRTSECTFSWQTPRKLCLCQQERGKIKFEELTFHR